jgi:hypothetical protein
MRLYAERPVRAAGQVLCDLGALVWAGAWVWLASVVHASILEWQAPGRRLVEAGGGLQRTFGDAARAAGGVPFVGGDLAGVLGGGTTAGDVLVDAGRGQIEVVGYGATACAVGIVILALVPLLCVWLPLRIRYARAAGTAVTMRAEAADLLALRALNVVPYRRLKKVSADPAAAWRAGDREVIDRLVALQLRGLGLRLKG